MISLFFLHDIDRGNVEILTSVLGILFLCGLTLVVGALAAMRCNEQVRVALGPDRLQVFTGVSGIGRTKEIRVSDIIGVTAIGKTIGAKIAITSPTSHYRFGSLLTRRRRDFILRALQQTLNDPDHLPPPTSPSALPTGEASRPNPSRS